MRPKKPDGAPITTRPAPRHNINPVDASGVTTPAMSWGCKLEWKELPSAVYPRCRYVAMLGALEFRLAHFGPADMWRLTSRSIATNESPYSGWLRDEWFDSKEAAQAAAEAHVRSASSA